MDAVNVLKQQHREVEQLFAQCKQLGEGAPQELQRIVQTICEKLTIHTRIEHDVFYPEVKQAAEEGKEEVLEGLEEHHLVKILLKQLAELSPEDETYMAKLTVLEELVQHHVEEEEEKMFKVARDAIEADRLETLGQQLEAVTRELESQEPQVTITMLEKTDLKTERL